MKRLLILVIFLITSVSSFYPLFSQWRRVIDKATFDISVNPRNPDTFFAGGEGRIAYRSYDGGVRWDTLVVIFPFGSSMLNNVLIHPIDTNIVIMGGLNFGSVVRTTDHGKTWDVVLSKTNPIELNGKSMMFKPDAPDTVYLGDFRYAVVYRSIDKGATWDSIGHLSYTVKVTKPDGSIEDSVVSTTVGSTACREDSTNILVFGSTFGEMFISTNGGYNWKFTQKLISPTYDQTDCEVTRIVFSDRDPLTGYACITYLFSKNTNNGGLYRTTDGGWSWKPLAFPDTSLWALACRGFGSTDEIFIGGYTEDFYVSDTTRVPGVGIVRRSQDGGKTWWSYDAGIDWALESQKTNSRLTSVSFANIDTGFVVGKYGVILKTLDSGRTWNSIVFDGKPYFTSVIALDAKNVIICSMEGLIYKSTNGGGVWQQVLSPNKFGLNSMFRIDNSTLIAVGDSGNIIKSTDKGNNWRIINNSNKEFYRNIFFIDDKNGWMCGNNGSLMFSSDAGESWSSQTSGALYNLNSICFTDINTGYAVGDSGTVISTTDAGKNWFPMNFPAKVHLNSVAFPNTGTGSVGFICGEKGSIYRTFNTGKNWIKQNTASIRDLYFLYFLDSENGFALGNWSSILKTTDSGFLWDMINWGTGPRANMWSLRYLGKPGEEKLYMATEAGLFVLDYPSYIEYQKQTNLSSNLRLLISDQKILNVEYDNNTNNSQTGFMIYDINGKLIQMKNSQSFDKITHESFDLSNITNGAYVLVAREGSFINTRIFLIR